MKANYICIILTFSSPHTIAQTTKRRQGEEKGIENVFDSYFSSFLSFSLPLYLHLSILHLSNNVLSLFSFHFITIFLFFCFFFFSIDLSIYFPFLLSFYLCTSLSPLITQSLSLYPSFFIPLSFFFLCSVFLSISRSPCITLSVSIFLCLSVPLLKLEFFGLNKTNREKEEYSFWLK